MLRLSDRTFGEFVHEAIGIDIHSDKYAQEGTSKARKLRALWTIESDYVVGTLLMALIEYCAETPPAGTTSPLRRSPSNRGARR